jgi:hypothetical protein
MDIYLSPASLEHAEITENISFKKSLRGRFFKTSHPPAGIPSRSDEIFLIAGLSAAIKNNFISAISVCSVRDCL